MKKDWTPIIIGAFIVMALLASTTISSSSAVNATTEEAQTTTTTEEGEPQCGVLIDLSYIEDMINKGTADQTMINNYNDELRTEEIMSYIDENMDDLEIPDWMKEQDTKSGLCLTAGDVAEQERLQGRTLTGEELDEAIMLAAVGVQGDAAASVLSSGQ